MLIFFLSKGHVKKCLVFNGGFTKGYPKFTGGFISNKKIPFLLCTVYIIILFL